MKAIIIGGLAVCLALTSMTAFAEADKVTICHATGSETNPYVEITIARQAWENGHSPHAVHVRDFLVPSGRVCLARVQYPGPTPNFPPPWPTIATSVAMEPTAEPNTDAGVPPVETPTPSLPAAFPDSGGAPEED